MALLQPVARDSGPPPFAPMAADTNPDACCDGVDLHTLAARVDTPFHAYSAAAIRHRIQALKTALHGLDARICYALKANPNVAIVHLMADAGLGADIVSGGELERGLRAGLLARDMVFSGVGKTADEIDTALRAGVGRFNLESRDELELLERLAARRGVRAHASVRINPDVHAHTHAKITTGKADNKFGVDIVEARAWFASARSRPQVLLDGLHVHIGSQLLELAPLAQALDRAMALAHELQAQGHDIACIDVGGGLGVRYRASDRPPSAADWAEVIGRALAGFKGRILLEPGRWLVAEAGILVTRVVRVKQGRKRRFVVLDAAMNDLPRPALYDAWHEVVPLVPAERARGRYDVVGPVCETGDTLARDRDLPECRAGDLVLIRATGAYTASMASTYNSRPLAAEVLLDQGRFAVIRTRQSLEQMLAGEQAANHWETP